MLPSHTLAPWCNFCVINTLYHPLQVRVPETTFTLIFISYLSLNTRRLLTSFLSFTWFSCVLLPVHQPPFSLSLVVSPTRLFCFFLHFASVFFSCWWLLPCSILGTLHWIKYTDDTCCTCPPTAQLEQTCWMWTRVWLTHLEGETGIIWIFNFFDSEPLEAKERFTVFMNGTPCAMMGHLLGWN